jgi:hypothetical protein
LNSQLFVLNSKCSEKIEKVEPCRRETAPLELFPRILEPMPLMLQNIEHPVNPRIRELIGAKEIGSWNNSHCRKGKPH